MISLQQFLPPQSGELGAIFSLLQVIGDPKAAKAVLEKMAEQEKAIENATAKQAEQFKADHERLAQERAEADKLKRTADTIASKAAHELGEAKATKADADRRLGQCQEIEKRTAEQRVSIEEHEKRLAKSEDEMTLRWKALEFRETAIVKREQDVAKAVEDLTMREKTLADDIAEHNKWLAGLKPPRAR